VEKNGEEKSVEPAVTVWGGMKKSQLSTDNVLGVFLTRNLESLSQAPIIKSIFFRLLDRSTKELGSLLGLSLDNRDYFMSTYKVYKEKFIN